MADDGANNLDVEGMADVFVYMGVGLVPQDVVRCRVHPSVTVIPQRAFMHWNYALEEIELCEGLLEIGERAFYNCTGLKRLVIPSTVRVVRDQAFAHCSKLEQVELPDGLLEIGEYAFYKCKSLKHINLPPTIRNICAWTFAETESLMNINLPEELENVGVYPFLRGGLLTFRIPPLITIIPMGMVGQAESLFSIEFSESVTHLGSYAFSSCYSLRNLAIPPNISIENDYNEFCQCLDMQQLFGTRSRIISALKHRFDKLPIHKMLYYQSYESVTVDKLNSVTNMRSGQRRSLRSKLDPTGKQQDCLGMTPLHILACSTVQDIGLYQVLIEKYPDNLITEDRWGTLPLLYAVWGNASSEIVQYLVERYQSIYPEYEFDWTKMVETLGRGNVPKDVIEKLVDLQKVYFPKQNIDWERLIGSVIDTQRIRSETFGYLVQFSLAKRIGAIGLKQWRDDIKHTAENCSGPRQDFITEVKTKLTHYETEYHNLKEATSLLELALWKHKMNDHILGEKKRRRKKTKIDDSSIREQCRISCGADIVIEHMLPYLFALSK